MSREIIANVEPRQTRVAITENGKLLEIYIERGEGLLGNIYKGLVTDVLEGMETAFVDIGLARTALLPFSNVWVEKKIKGKRLEVKSLLKKGAAVLAQVVREPIGSKGAKLNMRIALPGRYLVLMTPGASRLGISLKIEDEKERDRLRKLARALRPDGFGLIVRTEAEGKDYFELAADLRFLLDLWRKIKNRADTSGAPSLIFREMSLINRAARDFFTEETERFVIDSPRWHQEILDLLEVLAPQLKGRVFLYQGEEPIFEYYGIENQIRKALENKIWLKSGGYITIDETEAFVTVDVNTGKFVGKSALEDTVLKTNLEAAGEIAHQIALRNIGGSILIDFIDMEKPEHRFRVIDELNRALKLDRTRPKLLHWHTLNLVQVIRRKSGKSLAEIMYQSCPQCRGRGKIWSAESLSIEIERELRKITKKRKPGAFVVLATPEVADILIGSEGENAQRLEEELGTAVYIRSRESLLPGKFEIKVLESEKLPKDLTVFEPDQEIEVQINDREPLLRLEGYLVKVQDAEMFLGQKAKIKLIEVGHSFAKAKIIQAFG